MQTPEQESYRRRLRYLAALGQWTPIVAHALSQPLTAIFNYVEGGKCAFTEVAQANPRFAEFLDEIERLSRRAAELVRVLRDYDRRHAPRPLPVDVNEVIGDALGLLACIDARVAPDLDLSADPPLAFVDPTALFQVLVSLMLNAAPQSGSWPRKVQVRTLWNVSGEVEIRICYDLDGNAVGAAAEPPIPRTGLPRSDATRRHGLHVSECRSLVESQGGRLTLSTARTGGTLVQLVLPGGHAPDG